MSVRSNDQTPEAKDTGLEVSKAVVPAKDDSHGFGLKTSEPSLNPPSLGTFSLSRFHYDFSQMKLQTHDVGPLSSSERTGLRIQRSPLDGSDSCPTCPEAETSQSPNGSEPITETTQASTSVEPTTEEPRGAEESAEVEEAPAGGLIVEDSATDLRSGQMRRSELLARLRSEVTRAAQEAMAGTGRTTEDCPYLEYWFGYYQDQDSAHLERAIHRYAPETVGVRNAADYIPVIARRVSASMETWARTGEITGVPEGLPGMGMMGMGLLGGLGRLFSGIGRMFFKAKQGGARKSSNPRHIQQELGEGQPLESGVRSRMEPVFGMDFSHVRAHTDSKAGDLSNDFNARAFTVGEHVAFGAGEYRPGTMVGDALIAHELAHVVQQEGSDETVAPMTVDESNYNNLEVDADRSAVGVVGSLWNKITGNMARIGSSIIPGMKSGLKLQRCGPSLPQLREPPDVLRESETFERQALRDIQQRGLEQVQRTPDERRRVDIAQAESNIETDLMRSFGWLRQIYQEELADAGSDVQRRRQAQYRFEQQIRRLRESYRRRFELNLKYHVNFTVGRSQILFQRTEEGGIQRWAVQAWSLEELNTIDRILDMIPRQYMQNFSRRIREIRREPRGDGEASWEESTGILRVYDRAFEHEDRLSLIIIHEVGHSTYQERTAGSFAHLPPADWMRLSDWQMFTRIDITSALGLRNAEERNEVLSRLDRNAGLTAQYERPIPVDTPHGRRWVVHDKYEGVFPPNRFFHFSDNHIDEFVSGYAQSHPAEDLAESFAQYMVNPDDTRRKLDVGRRGVTDKWDYLRNQYPHQLIRRKSKNNQRGDIYEQKADQVATIIIQKEFPEDLVEKK